MRTYKVVEGRTLNGKGEYVNNPDFLELVNVNDEHERYFTFSDEFNLGEVIQENELTIQIVTDIDEENFLTLEFGRKKSNLSKD